MFSDRHPTSSASDGKSILKSTFIQPGDPVEHFIECAQCGYNKNLDRQVEGPSTESDTSDGPGVVLGVPPVNGIVQNFVPNPFFASFPFGTDIILTNVNKTSPVVGSGVPVCAGWSIRGFWTSFGTLEITQEPYAGKNAMVVSCTQNGGLVDQFTDYMLEGSNPTPSAFIGQKLYFSVDVWANYVSAPDLFPLISIFDGINSSTIQPISNLPKQNAWNTISGFLSQPVASGSSQITMQIGGAADVGVVPKAGQIWKIGNVQVGLPLYGAAEPTNPAGCPFCGSLNSKAVGRDSDPFETNTKDFRNLW